MLLVMGVSIGPGFTPIAIAATRAELAPLCAKLAKFARLGFSYLLV
jgi:hypothetical protein